MGRASPSFYAIVGPRKLSRSTASALSVYLGHDRAVKESLANADLVRSLSADELEVLGKRCAWRHYTARQEIVAFQDDSEDVMFIIDGRVRVVIYSVTGKEVSFRDIDEGGCFGEFAAIDSKPRAASVVALTDCLVAFMPADVFWEVLSTKPTVSSELLKQLVGLLRLYSERVFEFSTLAVNNRIHAELLRLARDNMDGENSAAIQPAPTHSEIASRVSTSREAVTRELNRLAQSGLVEQHGREMRVLDVRRLDRMVKEVLGH